MRREASCEWGQNWSTLFLLYFVPNEVPVQRLRSPTVDPFQCVHTVGRLCCSNLTLRIKWWKGNLEHRFPYLHLVGCFFQSRQWMAKFFESLPLCEWPSTPPTHLKPNLHTLHSSSWKAFSTVIFLEYTTRRRWGTPAAREQHQSKVWTNRILDGGRDAVWFDQVRDALIGWKSRTTPTVDVTWGHLYCFPGSDTFPGSSSLSGVLGKWYAKYCFCVHCG